MKKLMALLLMFLAFTVQTHAVSFDNSVDEGATPSFTYNAGGTTNTMLVVGVFSTGAGSTLTAASFNGTPLTQKVMINGGTAGRSEFWYLASPASGAHTLSVTFSGTTPTAYRVVVASYDNVSGIGASNAKQQVLLGGVMSLSGTATSLNWSVFLVNSLVGGFSVEPQGSGNYIERRSNQSAGNTYTLGDEAADASGERFTTGTNDTLTGVTVELVNFVATPTWTPTATPTRTNTSVFSPTFTPTITLTATPTSTPSWSPTSTASPTWTPTASPTASPSNTNTPGPTMTPGLILQPDNKSFFKSIQNQTNEDIWGIHLFDSNGVGYSSNNPMPGIVTQDPSNSTSKILTAAQLGISLPLSLTVASSLTFTVNLDGYNDIEIYAVFSVTATAVASQFCLYPLPLKSDGTFLVPDTMSTFLTQTAQASNWRAVFTPATSTTEISGNQFVFYKADLKDTVNPAGGAFLPTTAFNTFGIGVPFPVSPKAMFVIANQSAASLTACPTFYFTSLTVYLRNTL